MQIASWREKEFEFVFPVHSIFQKVGLCRGTWSNYSVVEVVLKTDRNHRVAGVVPLAEEEDSQTDRSVRVPWEREELPSRKDLLRR